MARLIPKIKPSEIQNAGERKIAEALIEQLPNHVSVIHSFNWVKKVGSRPLIQGECDFIILDPQNGLLFIEVKGGLLNYDPETNGWHHIMPNGDTRDVYRDPIEQVSNNMYSIVEFLKTQHHWEDMPCAFGYAVAFPDGKFFGSLPANVTHEMILDASTLRNLKKSVYRIFRLFQRSQVRQVSTAHMRSIEQALMPKYQIMPVLCDSIEQQEKMLHRMTEEQMRLLDFLGMRKKAAIEGSAGTGKTLLALAKAQHLARAGYRTLLLCFNRGLKEWLQQNATSEFGDLLTVESYHGLVHKLCDKVGEEFLSDASAGDPDFWLYETPELLVSVCEKLADTDKYDALVVDEGQDFQELWWHSLDSVFRLSSQQRHFFVFYDPRQNLFADGETCLPNELGEPFPLQMNCRNTRKIGEHCAHLIDDDIQFPASSPEGNNPKIRKVKTLGEALRHCDESIRLLCNENAGGLKQSQVAIIAPRKTEPHWPQRFRKIQTTKSIEKWRANEGILMHSMHTFKGLEADAVVMLTEPVAKGNSRLLTENYVARTRAKHILHVIEVEKIS